jgi:hypothetical protein
VLDLDKFDSGHEDFDAPIGRLGSAAPRGRRLRPWSRRRAVGVLGPNEFVTHLLPTRTSLGGPWCPTVTGTSSAPGYAAARPGKPTALDRQPRKTSKNSAESEGFEPPEPLRARLISNQVPSTTRPALQM